MSLRGAALARRSNDMVWRVRGNRLALSRMYVSSRICDQKRIWCADNLDESDPPRKAQSWSSGGTAVCDLGFGTTS
jgi:hypothetical protein